MKVELTFNDMLILEHVLSRCLDNALGLPESDDNKKFVNMLYALRAKLVHSIYVYINKL